MKVKMDYKDNTAVGVFEVYDICADGYISNKEVCIDNPPSFELINEVIDVLGGDPVALRTYFNIYYHTLSDNYIIENNIDGIITLVQAGYLRRRADGKYYFCSSILNPVSASLGEDLYDDDWDAEKDCLQLK